MKIIVLILTFYFFFFSISYSKYEKNNKNYTAAYVSLSLGVLQIIFTNIMLFFVKH